MNRVVLALVAAPLLAAAPAAGITVGLVLDDTLGKTVNGWLHTGGEMYSVTGHKDGAVTLEDDCCIATFSKGRSRIVARTQPLARNAAGGVIKEKIVDLRRIDMRAGEIEVTCDLFGLQNPLSIKSNKTGMVRSVVVHEGALDILEWKDPANRCGEEGD